MNRRDFVGQLGVAGLLSTICQQHKCSVEDLLQASSDSEYWKRVKSDFAIANREDQYLHFNSGSVGTMSNTTWTALQKLIEHMNSFPPYEALNEWADQRARVKEKLAAHIDCSSEEISIIRNTTEGINIIINGAPLKIGDEILCAKHDYPHSLFAIQQRCNRDQLKEQQIKVDLLKGDDQIVDSYINAFNPNTKLLLLTMITHRQGYIMPVKRIVQEAQRRGIQVVLDAAHAIGHIDHSIRDLGVDYYASSLHKWLNAPHSTGLLFVKQDRIKDLMPLMAADERVKDKMVKFEYIGTRTFHQEVGLIYALQELDSMTISKKEKRLKYLTNYWIQKARKIPRFVPLSSFDIAKFGAVWTFRIDGLSSSKAKKHLQENYNIHVKTVGTRPVSGVRISTNIYHLESDLDRLVNAISEVSQMKGK